MGITQWFRHVLTLILLTVPGWVTAQDSIVNPNDYYARMFKRNNYFGTVEGVLYRADNTGICIFRGSYPKGVMEKDSAKLRCFPMESVQAVKIYKKGRKGWWMLGGAAAGFGIGVLMGAASDDVEMGVVGGIILGIPLGLSVGMLIGGAPRLTIKINGSRRNYELQKEKLVPYTFYR